MAESESFKEAESISWSLSRWKKERIKTRMTKKFLAWVKLEIMGQWRPDRKEREKRSDAVSKTNIIPALVEVIVKQRR